MIHLNNYYSTTKKEKNKHLTKDLYDKIQSEYNHYIFSKNKNINKTQKKAFKPSPVISPVYGILDKNYKKEDVITRDEMDQKKTIKLKNKNLTLESKLN